MSKIAMVPCWSLRPSTSCFPGCAISSPTVSTTAPTCPKLSPNSASGPSRSSNAPLTLSAFNCCRGAGSSNGPWLGSIATAAWRRISRRRLRAPRRGFTSPLYSSSSGDWLDPYAMYLRYNTTIPIQIQTLSRYLLLQTAINASLGVLVGSGLWFIGVPNPVLWGILTMLLRFVPYIGPVIAAAFPAALAVAVDPGWSMLFWVVGLFVVAEGIAGQVIEPWLYGQSTGLSGVAVVVAAAFWTLLLGPIGLLLSTPLTMCLVVLGRHVEHLQFLEVLLGDQPALAPEESFYQRMLADDPDEAALQAEAFLKDKPLSVYYDEVAIRGLALAQLDVNRGALDHAHRVRIKEAVEWVIDDLSDHDDASSTTLEADATVVISLLPGLSREELAPSWRETPVL